MKKFAKISLAISTFAITALSVGAFSACGGKGSSGGTGGDILFGTYPQSKVQDEALTDALNTAAGTLPTDSDDYAWESYGYKGMERVNGVVDVVHDEKYMWYQDVEYEGEEYRGVYFISYRSKKNYATARKYSDSTFQYNNGYLKADEAVANDISPIYWFKYEPIEWQILQKKNGYATIFCKTLIDSQAYQNMVKYVEGVAYAADESGNIIKDAEDNSVYANDYSYSTIRAWLNETFYQTAFSVEEQASIQTVEVENGAETTYDANSYYCANTQDKVWLLSYQEVASYLGEKTAYLQPKRQKKTSDYAQCQGACTATNKDSFGCGDWLLRSPAPSSHDVAVAINNSGNTITRESVNINCYGICPSLKIKL